jgi:hypothetical protein
MRAFEAVPLGIQLIEAENTQIDIQNVFGTITLRG